MTYLKYFIYTLFGLGLFLGSQTFAQTTVPAFSFAQDDKDVSSVEILPKTDHSIDLTFTKPIMRDTVLLQTQINLLENLLRRQTEIQQMAANYKLMGMSFHQPAPPMGACEKLPANVLCMAFYPNLDINKPFVSLLNNRFSELQDMKYLEAMANIEQSIDELSADGALSSGYDFTTPKTPDDIYAWSDITCLGLDCSVVLHNIDKNNFRLRVSEGDIIADGIKVTTINPNQITVTKDKEKYHIQPMNLSGDTVAIKKAAKPSDIPNPDIDKIIDNMVPTTEDMQRDIPQRVSGTGLF